MINISGYNYSSTAGSSIQNKIDKSIQRLSSGQRINAAKDDVAGMQISTRLNAEIKGLEQATKNAADAQSLIDTAEIASQQIESNLLRMRALALSSINGTHSSNDRKAINLEAQSLLLETNRIANETTWAGQTILDGSFQDTKIQVGRNSQSADLLTISIPSLSPSDLGIGTNYSIYGSKASSNYPGQNNSNDVYILGFFPGTDDQNFIAMTFDTTNGMNADQSNINIDNSLDPKTKVEILGIEYTLSPGTASEKIAQLSKYLTADGIANYTGIQKGEDEPLLFVESSTLSDYAAAFGSNTFAVTGNPLVHSDGRPGSQYDRVWASDTPNYNVNYTQSSLVSGYSKPDLITLRPNSTPLISTPQRIGEEFQVNTFSENSQRVSASPSQAIAALKNGDFVITWTSYYDNKIYAQIFNSDGTKKGSEFRVNSLSQGSQTEPTVEALDDGGFIIAFRSVNNGSYARRYDSSGIDVGEEFSLHDSTSHGSQPLVTALDNGRFLTTWSSQTDIYGRIFDANNSPESSEFMVNTFRTDSQRSAHVTKLKNGDFVITWASEGQDGSSYGIFGQRYNTSGIKIGDEFQINTFTYGEQRGPSITALEDGGFIVTWHSYLQDGDDLGVFGQQYNSVGVKIGAEFQINKHIDDNQRYSTAVGLSDGGFLVAWQSNSAHEEMSEVYGQRFDKDREKVGGEFQINSHATYDQTKPSLTVLANGNIVATYNSLGGDGLDGYAVFAQILNVGSTELKGLFPIDLETSRGSSSAVLTIDSALNKLNEIRSSLGALSNRLDNIMAVNVNSSINLKRAKGLITDANFAQETADLAKNNILQQTSIQMDVLSRKAGDSLRTLLNGDGFVYKQNFLY